MTASTENKARLVSRFEERLLRILHFLLRRTPAEQALPLIFDAIDAPPCLSRDAVNLIQDTLARGCIGILARTSGWWRERHLRDGAIVEGRLWERHPPRELALAFSRHTLGFLIWLTSQNPGAGKTTWPVLPAEQLTLGDQLFLYYVFTALRETEAARHVCGRQVFVRHGLCRLAYPEEFTEVQKAPTFAHWMTGTGAAILESLQAEVTERWLKVEQGKVQITDWQRMQALGQSQERVLTAFLDAVEEAGRFDLARFLFPALHALLPNGPRLEWWTEGLHGAGPRLADRSETLRAALVLPRLVSRLQGWEQQARAVGYFDENYAACQLYKADWERFQGEVLGARAQQLTQQIEPLR
jgi:hypothetical protein